MPHFQDAIAGHYVTKQELDQADQAEQADRNELGELHSSNLVAPIQPREPEAVADDLTTVWTEVEMETHITRELVLWHRRLSQAAVASGMTEFSTWTKEELWDFAAV